MAEPKWIKMDVYMFRHPKLLIIDSMEDSNLIYYLWTSSVLLAGECNMAGCLYISENMPYTLKSLAIVFRRSIDEVKKAYDVLMNLGMIEKTEDDIYRIKNWEKHQNVESLEKIRKQTNERVARFRERKREEKKKAEENNKSNNNEEVNDDETEKSTSDNEEADYDEGNIEDNTDDNENCNNDIISGYEHRDSSDDKYLKDADESGDDEIISGQSGKIEEKHCDEDRNGETQCSVTVTQENKKETKKKKKSRETERDNSDVSDSSHSSNSLTSVNSLKSSHLLKSSNSLDSLGSSKSSYSSNSSNADITGASIELSKYCERITGIVSALDIGALNLAVEVHGKCNVKKAMDKAIEAGRVNMPYINGILKNWRKEGYPEDEDMKSTKDGNIKGRGKGGRGYGKNRNVKGDGTNCSKSKIVRTKEPPKLTDEKRRKICESLI